jgi:putative ABC transport system permease protein
MSGSCALLTFFLGFYNSIGNTQDKYFNGFANYDVIVSFDPLPLFAEHPASDRMDDRYKALVLHVDTRDENYILSVTEMGFDMVDIPGAALKNGVIIPEYFADEWGVGIGDSLEIDGYDAVVSSVVPQHLGLTLYTSFDYLSQMMGEVPAVYNTIYGRSRDMAALGAYLKDSGIDFATIDDDKTSFDSIMESMSVLIWFMIVCSLVLGFTVLYSVGLINLSAREYEYMFMGVMGYRHKGILLAHTKETVLQLVLAIPLGFLLGNVILELIKGEFSSNNFVISATIFPQSYLVSAASVIGVTSLMALVTSRHIGGLDIVEGLKAQDE